MSRRRFVSTPAGSRFDALDSNATQRPSSDTDGENEWLLASPPAADTETLIVRAADTAAAGRAEKTTGSTGKPETISATRRRTVRQRRTLRSDKHPPPRNDRRISQLSHAMRRNRQAVSGAPPAGDLFCRRSTGIRLRLPTMQDGAPPQPVGCVKIACASNLIGSRAARYQVREHGNTRQRIEGIAADEQVVVDPDFDIAHRGHVMQQANLSDPVIGGIHPLVRNRPRAPVAGGACSSTSTQGAPRRRPGHRSWMSQFSCF